VTICPCLSYTNPEPNVVVFDDLFRGLETPAVGVLLVICTTEFSVCLNIVLRDKGLEDDEELVPWDEVFELICCSCATAVVDESINLLNEIVIIIIIATANTMTAANTNRFLIGVS
jgi:hypothetical protein